MEFWKYDYEIINEDIKWWKYKSIYGTGFVAYDEVINSRMFSEGVNF